MTKRQKRLAKNELVRRANKRRFRTSRVVNRPPLTCQVMMPKGPLPVCNVQMASESGTRTIKGDEADDV